MGGSILAFIGFVLSPLSWWNDAFVNLPLAFGFGWCVGLLYPAAFQWAVIVGYWLTNIVGLVLMHKGVVQAVSGNPRPYTRLALLRDLLISLAYTALIVMLIKFGVVQFGADTFAGDSKGH